MKRIQKLILLTLAFGLVVGVGAPVQAADTKKPNIVMLMQDDTGWNDFGCYSGGGVALGHPTPNVDRLAKELGSILGSRRTTRNSRRITSAS